MKTVAFYILGCFSCNDVDELYETEERPTKKHKAFAGEKVPFSTASTVTSSSTKTSPRCSSGSWAPNRDSCKSANIDSKDALKDATYKIDFDQGAEEKKKWSRKPIKFTWDRSDILQSYYTRFNISVEGEAQRLMGPGFWPQMESTNTSDRLCSSSALYTLASLA